MKSRKSQMEVLGLAVIVLFMALIMVFVIGIVLKEPEDQRKDYVQTQRASNVVNTLLKTTTDCHDLSIRELLQDCAEGGMVDCNAISSCDFANNSAKFIFDNTLKKWNAKYTFWVYIDLDYPLFVLGNECTGNLVERKSESFIVPTNVGTLYADIFIC